MQFIFPLVYISIVSFSLYWLLLRFPMLTERLNVRMRKNKIKGQNRLLSEIKEFEDEYNTFSKINQIYKFIKGEN